MRLNLVVHDSTFMVNRAPLGGHHNVRNYNRSVHLEGYHAEIAHLQRVWLVDNTREPIDLTCAAKV